MMLFAGVVYPDGSNSGLFSTAGSPPPNTSGMGEPMASFIAGTWQNDHARANGFAYECLSGAEPNGSVLYAGYGESGPDTYWVVGTINWV